MAAARIHNLHGVVDHPLFCIILLTGLYIFTTFRAVVSNKSPIRHGGGIGGVTTITCGLCSLGTADLLTVSLTNQVGSGRLITIVVWAGSITKTFRISN